MENINLKRLKALAMAGVLTFVLVGSAKAQTVTPTVESNTISDSVDTKKASDWSVWSRPIPIEHPNDIELSSDQKIEAEECYALNKPIDIQYIENVGFREKTRIFNGQEEKYYEPIYEIVPNSETKTDYIGLPNRGDIVVITSENGQETERYVEAFLMFDGLAIPSMKYDISYNQVGTREVEMSDGSISAIPILANNRIEFEDGTIGKKTNYYRFSTQINDSNVKYSDWSEWSKWIECESIDSCPVQSDGTTVVEKTQAFSSKIIYSQIISEEKISEKVVKITEKDETIAWEVVQGLWGNGEERKNSLEQNGYDAYLIQGVVNLILSKVDSNNIVKPTKPIVVDMYIKIPVYGKIVKSVPCETKVSHIYYRIKVRILINNQNVIEEDKTLNFIKNYR